MFDEIITFGKFVNMKCFLYLSVILLLIAGTGCSAKTSERNSAAQTPSTNENSATSDFQESGADTGLGKVSPDAVVRQLYDLHKNEKGPFFETKNRAMIEKFFDKSLADLIWTDLNRGGDEAGVLDFDALYNAQDIEIKKLTVGEAVITGEAAKVIVNFENFGQKQTITFPLVKRGDSWKISDIVYAPGESLIKYFKEDEKNRAAETMSVGNFEGTYRVGDTSCTVKPIKMAFELKWAKGSGTMIFFSDSSDEDGLTFESEDKSNGTDKFIFDNDDLTTGKFIRADGKGMPVKRLK